MRNKLVLLLVILCLISFSLSYQVQKDKEENQSGGVETESNIERITCEGIRIKKFPIAMQSWTFRKYSFFETLKKTEALGIKHLQPYPGQILNEESPDLLFDHNLSKDLIKQVKQRLEKHGISLVSYGVLNFDNNEESMRKVFDFAKELDIKTIVTEPEYDDYSLIEQMAKEYNIHIAIHNHPGPSKYAKPETVFNHVDGLDSRIGACADIGHWMRTGVDPLEALRMLEGRIHDVHLKDLDEFGNKEAIDVPFGQGKANIRDVLAELTEQNYWGYLAVEYENEDEVFQPSPSIREGLEYIRSITYYEGYKEILKRSSGRYSKHGWNHYGPGYFLLDEKSGVLKSQGGMGLFWLSERKFKDFILELEFKCSEKDTNSGIFVRVPEIPTSDDYIYHSFEVQIYDTGDGIHKTGAIYDAEAPSQEASKETGKWNHFKITFKGKHLLVELNGHIVIDWDAEPRGKVKDFADEGFIGLQNHDSRSPVYFRNIFVKE